MSQKNNNRVQSYLSDEMLKRLTEYAQNKELSQSKAIESILEMVLGTDEIRLAHDDLDQRIEKTAKKILFEQLEKISNPLYIRMAYLEHNYSVSISEKFVKIENFLRDFIQKELDRINEICPSGVWYEGENPSLEEIKRVSEARSFYQDKANNLLNLLESLDNLSSESSS